jgi:hypothetical protein
MEHAAGVSVMVIKKWMILLSLFFLKLNAAVHIDASIDQNTAQENTPLDGTITVTHPQTEAIDNASFQLDGKKLTPTFIKNNVISPETVVSIYSFTMPSQKAGLYVLPVVSIKVGSKIYHSIPTSYEVMKLDGKKSTPAARTNTKPASSIEGPATLRLEAKIKGPEKLYPGQRTKLFYRIAYNRNIDLTESNLPLIQPKDFQKIGDAHIQDYQETLYTIQEITQEIEALKPGNFQFGPSSIQGYVYEIDALGQKVYQPTPLQAEAPVIDLTVNPFPTHKPASFNGALGSIEASLKMISPSHLAIGEKIDLQLSVSGLTNLNQFTLPDLSCQPGFSGFFRLNDLPAAAKNEEGTKEFHLVLIPLTSLAQSVPSIEISSFDPATGSYKIQRTEPLAVTVQALKPKLVTSPQSQIDNSTPDWNKIWNAPFQSVSALTLLDPYVPEALSSKPWIGSPWVILMIPLGVLFILLMQGIHHYWLTCPKAIKLQSAVLMEQALHDKSLSPSQVIHLIERAAWWRLKEKGYLRMSPEKLPTEGPVGQLRKFILHLQSLEYSEKKDFILADIKSTASSLLTENGAI